MSKALKALLAILAVLATLLALYWWDGVLYEKELEEYFYHETAVD